MEKLPDLVSGIQYIQTLMSEEQKEINASYYKYESSIFGRIVAKYRDPGDSKACVCIYVLVYPDGTIQRAETGEELEKLILRYKG